jgi:hypothetical protein
MTDIPHDGPTPTAVLKLAILISGCAAPPIIRNIHREQFKWCHDSEMDGLTRIKGAAFDEAKP